MIVPMLAAAAVVSVQPLPLFAIGPSHRLLEGVATDGRTVWVSSVIDRTILACRKTCRPIAILPRDLHPLGMAWDSSRQRLWVTTDCPPFPMFKKCDKGPLVALDRAGRIKSRLTPPGTSFHSGDVSAANGHIFVGDTLNGAVYWLKPGAASLATLVAPGVGRSAQSTALDASGTRLIVADYGQGVATVDLATGKRTLLLRENGKMLRGIDGLVRCGDRYFAVLNGQEPNALLAFTVNGGRIKIEELYSGPELPAPTQVAVDRKRLIIAGDASWDKVLKPSEQPHGPFPIRWLPLSQICGP